MAKSQDLPGMEDRGIPGLDDAAAEYAAIRDARMDLNKQEIELKSRLKVLMHKHKKTHYAHDGIEIDLIPPDGEESIKVKIAKPKTKVDTDGDEEPAEA